MVTAYFVIFCLQQAYFFIKKLHFELLVLVKEKDSIFQSLLTKTNNLLFALKFRLLKFGFRDRQKVFCFVFDMAVSPKVSLSLLNCTVFQYCTMPIFI